MPIPRKNEIPPDVKSLGVRVRALRKEWNITVKELSSAAGISTSQLAGIEQGKNVPSVLIAFKLARALDVSLNDLVQGFDSSNARLAKPYRKKISSK